MLGSHKLSLDSNSIENLWNVETTISGESTSNCDKLWKLIQAVRYDKTDWMCKNIFDQVFKQYRSINKKNNNNKNINYTRTTLELKLGQMGY